ncbi:MAG TPA: hypothetical protein VIL20_29755 [Sandaracinaceae bacterium]
MSAPAWIFASCAPGLEPMLAEELASLGALEPRVVPGGVTLRGHRRVIYRANLESGLASHVLVRVASFVADRFDVLERELEAIAWEKWLLPGVPRTVRASAKKSRLHHTGALIERAERAIAARLGDDGAGEGEPVPVALRVERDRVLVSIDTSGSPLHRRGYRVRTTAAPLREDLARALVVASGWDPSTPLVDPVCGSGTIAIEAAALARRLPPGRLRSFAFERTALFDEATWREVRRAALARSLPRAPAPIRASDRDPAAIDAARANAERAGVAGDLSFAVSPVSELELPTGGEGALVANPPYGHRLGDRQRLAALYRAIGRRAAERPGWRLAVLTSERRLGMLVSGELRTAFVTKSGGLGVRALVR